jgi:hypothetical protein
LLPNFPPKILGEKKEQGEEKERVVLHAVPNFSPSGKKKEEKEEKKKEREAERGEQPAYLRLYYLR